MLFDINHSNYSDGRNPSSSFEQDVLDNPRSSQPSLSTSPQVELDIDIPSNGFSDWLEAFSNGDPKKEALAKKRLTRLIHPASLNVKLGELKEAEAEPDRGVSSEEDMVADLHAVDVSYKVQLHLWHRILLCHHPLRPSMMIYYK